MYVHIRKPNNMTRADLIKLIAQNKLTDSDSQKLYELKLSKQSDQKLIEMVSYYGFKVEKYCSEFIFKF